MTASRKAFHANVAASALEPQLLEVSLDNAPIGAGGTIEGVEIFVYEVDEVNKEKLKGESKFDPKTNQDDLVCAFTVTISHVAASGRSPEQFRLTETGFRKQTAQPGHFVGAVLSIKLVGANNPIHRVEVLFHTRERREKNRPPWMPSRPQQLEFGVDVRAKGLTPYSGRKRIDALETHVDSLGPVATFVLQPAGTDNFYLFGAQYWRSRSDALFAAGERAVIGGKKAVFDGSLQKAWEFLAAQPADPVYQEVNLLSHGTIGAFIAADTAGSKVRRIDAQNVRALRDALSTRESGKLLPRCLSATDSRLVIRGCTVGRDPLLLEELSRLFGGVRVFAPKDRLLFYGPIGSAPTRRKKGTPRTEIPVYELVMTYYYVFVPVEDVALANLANEPKKKLAAKHLSKQYPKRSEAQFLKMLGKTLASWNSDAGGTATRDLPRYLGRHGGLMELRPMSVAFNTDTPIPDDQVDEFGREKFDEFTWSAKFNPSPLPGDIEFVRYDVTKLNREADPRPVSTSLWDDSVAFANAFEWQHKIKKTSGPKKVNIGGRQLLRYEWEVTFKRTRVEALEMQSDNDDLDRGEPLPLSLKRDCGSAKVKSP